MVGTLLKLQLKLFWRQLRSSVSILVMNIIFALLWAGSVIMAFVGLIALRWMPTDVIGIITVTGFGILTICWPIMSLFMGSNEMLDIGKFALSPIRANQLIPGLLIAGFTGLGGIFTILLCLGLIVSWSSSVLSLLGVLIGAVLGLVTCVLASRVITSAMSGVFRKRKARDLMMLAMFLAIFAVSFGMQALSRVSVSLVSVSLESIVTGATKVAEVISYTPFGWAWAIPWSIARGDWGLAVIQFVAAAGLVAGLWVIWTRQVNRGLTSPIESSGSSERVKGTSFYDRFLPYSPAGSIAKRVIRYYRRDPRRLMQAIAMFIIPVMIVVFLFITPVEVADVTDYDSIRKVIISFAPVAFSWMAGVLVAADICYDGSALGTEILSGISGRDDRAGRAIAILFFFAPLQLLLILAGFIYTQQWSLLPGVLGIAIVMLVGGIGIGNLISSVWQYSQPPPGGNMFGKGASGGVGGFISSMLGMFAPLVLAVPSVVLAIIGAVQDNILFGVASLVVGTGLGALLYILGINVGGKRLDTTWPEVLDKVTWKN
jgi:ABC-2 type transport system permease protein